MRCVSFIMRWRARLCVLYVCVCVCVCLQEYKRAPPQGDGAHRSF